MNGSDGGVPEWLKGPVSKTGVPLRGTVGLNPTSSASGTISITSTTRPAHLVGHPEKL